MTIKTGDRVRVHADGEVVGAGGDMLVVMLSPRDNGQNWDRTTRRHQERTARFYSDEVELGDKSLVQDNGWRDVCADMIREGKDPEALAQLVENSPSVSILIKKLEALDEAFGHLPNQATFREVFTRGAALNPQPSIVAYEQACDCYRKIREWRDAAAAAAHMRRELAKEPE